VNPYLAYLTRSNYAPGDYMHGILGPLEHQQFARETVGRNPLMAIPLGIATPLYSAGKVLGLTNARSAPTMDEIFAAYHGIGQGFGDYMRPK
jgi:hypothetical protein